MDVLREKIILSTVYGRCLNFAELVTIKGGGRFYKPTSVYGVKSKSVNGQ